MQLNPTVILDSAHNPAGMVNSHRFIADLTYKRLIVVAGFSRDKDYKSMVKTLSDADVFIATKYKSERSLETGETLKYVKGEAVEDVGEAVNHALSKAAEEDLVFVTGSIYVTGEAIRLWRQQIDL
jgi:dihydrofolate synthase/folylpolyglutamate synthase